MNKKLITIDAESVNVSEPIEFSISPLPTIIIGCLIGGIFLAYLGGFFRDGSKPAKPAIMPTSPLASLATPTARPTRTATTAPTVTSTPQPTNTALPTIAPSATPDLEFIAKQKLIENGANNQWWQITTDGIGSLLWKVGIFLGFLVVCFCASWLAFVTGWRALKDYQNEPKVGKVATMPVNAPTVAQDSELEKLGRISVAISAMRYTRAQVFGWVKIIDEQLNGVLTSNDEIYFYPGKSCPNPEAAIFKTQQEYRAFFRKMDALKFLDSLDAGGYAVSELCYKWLEYETE